MHLKRFNFVNNKWVKSQKVVNFPFKDFDPTPYLASVPQETILRHKELIEHGNTSILSNGLVVSGSNSNLENDSSYCEEHSIMSDSIREVDSTDAESTVGDMITNDLREIATKADAIEMLNEKSTDKHQVSNHKPSADAKLEQSPSSKPSTTHSKRSNSITASSKVRKRLVSTSLTKSPVIDGAFVDYHDHNLNDGQDPFDLKYKLYAVVVRIRCFNLLTSLLMRFICNFQSHSGMLSGGHYISYAANPNNSWYCYNDSSCREISQQQPNIDPSAAYLLFYERQGLNYSPYLPKVDDKSIPINTALEFDDSDNDLRKMCVIS